ncbi:unnamed protein product, partial [Ixodes pacificus]
SEQAIFTTTSARWDDLVRHWTQSGHRRAEEKGKVRRISPPLSNGMSSPTDRKGILAKDVSFQCPNCGKTFCTDAQLAVHRRVHTSKKSFECATCGQCFSHASGLSRHRRTHVNYVCGECGKRYMGQEHLDKHRLLAHTCLDN